MSSNSSDSRQEHVEELQKPTIPKAKKTQMFKKKAVSGAEDDEFGSKTVSKFITLEAVTKKYLPEQVAKEEKKEDSKQVDQEKKEKQTERKTTVFRQNTTVKRAETAKMPSNTGGRARGFSIITPLQNMPRKSAFQAPVAA